MSAPPPDAVERLWGAVLAGGRSRRFGSSKAAATVGGEALLARAVDALTEVFGARVVVVSSRALPPCAAPVIGDVYADHGPIGGLHAALAHAAPRGGSGVLALACDLPFVDARVLRALVEAWDGCPALAPSADGHLQPLCALYRVDVLAVVESLLGQGGVSMHGLFEAVGGRTLASGVLGLEDPGRTFLNVNTPAERARADRLARGAAG